MQKGRSSRSKDIIQEHRGWCFEMCRFLNGAGSRIPLSCVAAGLAAARGSHEQPAPIIMMNIDAKV
jgi:hypothetical protein